jgi:hypothetical protein
MTINSETVPHLIINFVPFVTVLIIFLYGKLRPKYSEPERGGKNNMILLEQEQSVYDVLEQLNIPFRR